MIRLNFVLSALSAALLLPGLLLSVTMDARAEADQREVVLLDAESRAFVIHEMQQFVSGLQQAITALAEEDMKGVATALRPMGMQGMSNAPPTLMSSVPMGFRQIGMPIHMAFDKLAASAELGATPKEILEGIGMAMNRCVACHAAYRIEPGSP